LVVTIIALGGIITRALF